MEPENRGRLTSAPKRFALVRDIAANHGRWMSDVFLTFDIDWCHDDVLAFAVDLVEQAGVPATWFVTHDTPLLARLRANQNFELGVHPNFNNLLDGSPANGATSADVLDRLMALVPEARSVRSHSLLQSSRLLDLFASRGLTHECNEFLPVQSGVVSRPWQIPWADLVRVPHCWEDDLNCLSTPRVGIPEVLASPGLKVFNFHPIHIFLNTFDFSRYLDSANLRQSPAELAEWRHPGPGGARDLLVELLSHARAPRTASP